MIPALEIDAAAEELIGLDDDLRAVMTPLDIAGVTAKNRLVCSPMSTNMADSDGGISSDLLHFYGTMARSGVGFVTIGGTSVSKEGACSAHGTHIGPKALNGRLSKLASVISEEGAVSSLQIMHVGAQGNTRYTGEPVLGPSPYVEPNIGIEATPLSLEEIHRIEREFVDAVFIALDCGFDFVELHLAHGYLLHEFAAPYFNKRTDEYGGPTENRLRILQNILDGIAARDAAALNRVGARLSGNDFIEGGLTMETNRPLVEMFNDYGTAYWVISAGIYETSPKKYEAMRRGDYWRYAEELKAMTRAPVVAQGGIRSLRDGGHIINAGQSDMVGMAQALLSDPMILHKTLAGDEDKVDPCIECGRCRYLRRTDLTFDCLVENGYHPPDMAALANRVSPEAIARETPEKALDLPRRRRIHPEGHV